MAETFQLAHQFERIVIQCNERSILFCNLQLLWQTKWYGRYGTTIIMLLGLVMITILFHTLPINGVVVIVVVVVVVQCIVRLANYLVST